MKTVLRNEKLKDSSVEMVFPNSGLLGDLQLDTSQDSMDGVTLPLLPKDIAKPHVPLNWIPLVPGVKRNTKLSDLAVTTSHSMVSTCSSPLSFQWNTNELLHECFCTFLLSLGSSALSTTCEIIKLKEFGLVLMGSYQVQHFVLYCCATFHGALILKDQMSSNPTHFETVCNTTRSKFETKCCSTLRDRMLHLVEFRANNNF